MRVQLYHGDTCFVHRVRYTRGVDKSLKQQLERIRRHALRLRRRTVDRMVKPAVGRAYPVDGGGRSTVPAEDDTVGPYRGAPAGMRRRTFDARDFSATAWSEGKSSGLEAWRSDEMVCLDDVVPGTPYRAGGADFYRVRYEGGAVDADAPREIAILMRQPRWPTDVEPEVMRARPASGQPPPIQPDVFDAHRVVFVDIETGGLNPNTYLFLCGLMYIEGETLVMDQAFARDYAEEAGVMNYVSDTLARFDAVITYNGDRFDLPFIRTRLAVHCVSPEREPASVDLIHAARRAFRRVLPNCRLLTVEQHLRGVERTGDIPGRLIPEAWHEFVRTQNADLIRNVLYHNRMDIFTMAVIFNRFACRDGTGFPESPAR